MVITESKNSHFRFSDFINSTTRCAMLRFCVGRTLTVTAQIHLTEMAASRTLPTPPPLIPRPPLTVEHAYRSSDRRIFLPLANTTDDLSIPIGCQRFTTLGLIQII